MERIYDVITVGGGTAALSAGIYAGRAMVDTLIIEKDKIGGQVTTTSDIVNYPGFRKITGPELTEQMRIQAQDFGCEFATDDIVSVNLDGDIKELTGKSGTVYKTRTVIIATGASPNRIGFPGEKEFTGRGVAYCSTCDGEFFTGLDVFVVGGGYAAAEEAVYLTRYARKVHIIVRKDDFSCAEMTAEQAKTHPQIDISYNTEVKEVSGDGLLQQAVFVNNKTGEETVYKASEEDGTFGLFVFAGHKPNTDVFKGIIDTNERGYAVTNEFMETNIPGVYAAGDIRYKELQQIVTAVADGAIAATKAQTYAITEKKRLGIEHVLKTPSKPVEDKQPEKTSAPSDKPAPQHSGAWFPAEMKDQLAQIFAKLTKPVKLVNVLDAANEKSVELSGFLNEFSTISSFISFEEIKKGADPTFEEKIDLTRSPSAALLDENDNFTGIKFSGIPSGHELNSLVLAVYNTGSEGQPLTDDQLSKIKALPKTKIEICVSLTCHFCPDVVAAAQHIAALNPNIEAEMIDTGLFPELKKEKKIMSVPAMIINDKEVIFGAQTMDQIIEELAK